MFSYDDNRGFYTDKPVTSGTGFVFPPAQNVPAANVQQHPKPIFSQAGNATAETRVIAVVTGLTGLLKSLSVGVATAAVGDSTATIDLKKSTGGGAFATVLTAPISITSATPARTLVAGSLASTSMVADDLLAIVVTATPGSGTPPTGLFACLDMVEDKTS